MTAAFHALWMLCSLGAIICAAASAPCLVQYPVMVLAFAATAVAVGPGRLPDVEWSGALTALAAMSVVMWPRRTAVAAAAAGALAGFWTALLELQGLPAWASAPAALALLALVIWLARTRPSFAPEPLREEALMILAVIGLGVAALPGVLEGWQLAASLGAADQRDPTRAALPSWTLVLVGASMVLGALHALWSRW
jgi:hypothetical protein